VAYVLAVGTVGWLLASARMQDARGVASTSWLPIADASCVEAATPATVSATVLDTNTPVRDGVVSSPTKSQLERERAAGNFSSVNLPIEDTFLLSCSGDFDEDG
jgi:hypothetical protein